MLMLPFLLPPLPETTFPDFPVMLCGARGQGFKRIIRVKLTLQDTFQNSLEGAARRNGTAVTEPLGVY